MVDVSLETDSACLRFCVEDQNNGNENNNAGAQSARFGCFDVQQNRAVTKLSELSLDDLQKHKENSSVIPAVAAYSPGENYLPDHYEKSTDSLNNDDLACKRACSMGNPEVASQSNISSEVNSGSGLTEASPLAITQESGPVSEEEAFERLVERFLNIPHSFFNQDVVRFVESAKARKMALHGSKAKAGCFTPYEKVRLMFINKLVPFVKGEICKEKTKEKLIQLQGIARGMNYDLTMEVQVLLHLKCFRDVLEGEHVSENDRDAFLSFLLQEITPDDFRGNPVVTFDFFKKDLFKKLDAVSLQVLFYLGVLPGYYEYVNYFKAFKMLGYIGKICEGFSYLLTPVSFSKFDYFRYCSITEKQLVKTLEKNNTFECSHLTFFLQIIAAQYFSVGLVKCKLDFKYSAIVVEEKIPIIYPLAVKFVDYYQLIRIDRKEKGYAKKVEMFNAEVSFSVKKAAKGDRRYAGEYKAFGAYLKAAIILKMNPKPGRKVLLQLANLINEVAAFKPLFSVEAFKFYRQASDWVSAGKSARQYSDFWQGKNDFLTAYWEDISIQMSLMVEENKNKEISMIEDDYDLDKVVEQLMAEGVIVPARVSGSGCSSGKKRQHDCQHVVSELVETAESSDDACNDDYKKGIGSDRVDKKADPGCGMELSGSFGEERDSDKPEHTLEVAAAAKCTLDDASSNQNNPEEWVSVRKKKNSSNRDGGNCIANSAKEVAGKIGKSAIGNWQKLLSRNWNPAIKKIVWLMHLARAQSDLDKEEKLFNLLFRLKDTTGKQRLKLERGWTELHKFDDVFKIGILPELLRKQGSEWINKALDTYFFPVLADSVQLLVGGEKALNIHDPKAVEDAVFQRVNRPELSAPEVNQEIRFHFRCLFSSIGHAYSLRAMLSREQHDRNFARQWYILKRIG